MYEGLRRQSQSKTGPTKPRTRPTWAARSAAADATAQVAGPSPIHDTRSLLTAGPAQREADHRGAYETRRAPNRTGLPNELKAGIEGLSGLSMDDVRVHYRSPEPARFGALAHAHGADIHIAPGQERHLPHEAWHVIQQARGRVRPMGRIGRGASINDDPSLEHEANVMGRRAAGSGGPPVQRVALPLLRLPRPHFPTVVQAYRKTKSGGGDVDLLSQSSKPSVTTQDGSSAFSYKQHKTKSGGADFLVADDDSVAVQDTDREPKQFFAKSQVLHDANESLRESGSPVCLENAGGTVKFGSHTLAAIKPDRVEGGDKEKFVDLWDHVCINLANRIMGNATSWKGEAVLQSGDHQASLDIEPTGNEGGPPVDKLAAHLTSALEPEDPLGAEAEPQIVLDAASTAISGPQVQSPGRAYGEATHKGKIGRAASRLGVNENARPNVGEGFATFSVSAGTGEADDYTSGTAERHNSAWGYHYAAVVAKSTNKKDYITLQNYKRDENDNVIFESILQKYADVIKSRRENLEREGKNRQQIENNLYSFLTKYHMNARKDYIDLSREGDDASKRAWFFRIHGSQSGQSFHEQQAATREFANPLTLRVRRDIIGNFDRRRQQILQSFSDKITWKSALPFLDELKAKTVKAFDTMQHVLDDAKTGGTEAALTDGLQRVRALYDTWCTEVFVPSMAKALQATQRSPDASIAKTLAELKKQAGTKSLADAFNDRVWRASNSDDRDGSLKGLSAAINGLPRQVV